LKIENFVLEIWFLNQT